MSDNLISNNKTIAKNTLYLYFRMLLMMVVQLYTSRVVLNVLGVEDYGIYNIVGGVVILFSFINSSLASATQRFLNFELGKNDIEKVKQIFSISLIIHIYVAVVVLVLSETIGLWFLNTQMNIPQDRMYSANWAYQFSIFTTCLSFIRVPYNACVISYEKMSFFAYVGIVEVVLKLLTVFLLIYIGLDKLKVYSVLTFGVSIVIFICYKLYCNIKIETSRYKYYWDKNLFTQLLSFSGWTLLCAAAGVGATQGGNILLNIFYGVSMNAAVGIGNQVNNAVNQFVSNFQTAFMPQLTKLYAVGDLENLRNLLYRSSRFSFMLLFAIACPLMLNIDLILKLWLKNVPEYSAIICILILIYSLVEAISKPLGLSVHATGKMKTYNILMSLALSMNIVLSYFFLKFGFSPMIVFIIYIFSSIVCLFIRLWFSSYYGIAEIGNFLRNVIFRVLGLLITLLIPIYLSKYYDSWQRLLLTCIVFFITYIPATLFIGFTQSERRKILEFAKRKINKSI